MTNTRDIIIKLKQVREERGLSYSDIIALLERDNQYLSKSTIARVFSDGSEDMSFKYEETIRPIANALLDIETIEDDDNMDIQAMKVLLKYKIQCIEDLERANKDLKLAMNQEKIKHHEKLDAERERSARSIEFLKEQIALKDKRMDQLLEAVFTKDKQYAELLTRLIQCQRCSTCGSDV